MSDFDKPPELLRFKVIKAIVFAGLGVGALYGASLVVPGLKPSQEVEIDDKLTAFAEEKSTATTTGSAAVTPEFFPTEEPASLTSVLIRALVLPWMAQKGAMYANGGKVTMKGSFNEKYNVNVEYEMSDDYVRMRTELVACAEEMFNTNSTECTAGKQLVSIMGDGAGSFLYELEKMLERLGPEYKAEIIGGFGRSNGEDAFMGPPECATDATKCRGLLVGGVPLDGDWDIKLDWAAKNKGKICYNPDFTTYDPDCLNLYATKTYSDADKAYISGYCEERPVVKAGKKTGENRKVCVGGTLTWTPGDVNVFREKGGLVKIWSTAQNTSQMGNVFIGISKWNAAHEDEIVNFLRAGYEGGALVTTNKYAMKKASQVEEQVYGILTAAEWMKYYYGATEIDNDGNQVQLGGSKAWTFKDAERYFGLKPGSTDFYENAYTTFATLGVKLHPELLPSFHPYDTVMNKRYLRKVQQAAEVKQGELTDVPTFDKPVDESKPVVVTKKDWSINFQSGRADFSPNTEATLDELRRELNISENTRVSVIGHTDSDGDAGKNQVLSDARAVAVREWLVAKGIDPKRFTTVEGRGENESVATNETADGKAQNRRVAITLSSN